jgi:hypothetical protein
MQSGYDKICWGSDYSHMEGTRSHTQKSLHVRFDDVPAPVRVRMTQDAYRELLPRVTAAPAG